MLTSGAIKNPHCTNHLRYFLPFLCKIQVDFIGFEIATAGVTFTLAQGINNIGSLGLNLGTDTYSNFEGVVGSNFNDTLTGSNLNDVLIGGQGDDSLDGGTGIDQIGFTGATAGITFTLQQGPGPFTTSVLAGGVGNDTYSNMEGVLGSNFADSITGSSANDSLSGGDGNDTLVGGAGNDTLDGGDGIDFMSFAGATGNVSFTLTQSATLSTFLLAGGLGNDAYRNIEGVIGSNFNDTLSGSAFADTIDGSAGNDSLSGNDGNDLLLGGDGNDILSGGNNNDTLLGGAGNDTLNGGQGDDLVDGGDGVDTIDRSGGGAAQIVNLATGSLTGPLSNIGNDTLVNIENVLGSAFDDLITGDGNANRLDGGTAGNDTLVGGANNDTLLGGAGDDYLDGGENAAGQSGDTDVLIYDVAGATAVTVNLATHSATGTFSGTDTLFNIESIVGTQLGDTFTGGDSTNLFNNVSEQFEGRGGNDIITGGSIAAGFTTFARYDNAPTGAKINLSGVDIDLGGGVMLLAGTARDGYGTVDTLTNVNRIRGSAFADVIYGGDSAAGGIERFEGMAGNDTIHGGAGIDIIVYQNSSLAVNVALGLDGSGTTLDGLDSDTLTFGMQQGTDTFDGIEGVRGSGFADSLTGSDRVDVVERFEGLAGNDTIAGGDGLDRVEYGGSSSGVVVNLATGTASDGFDSDSNTAGVQSYTDTLSGIEQIAGSRLNDSLTGDANNNQLTGSSGHDILVGAGGADTFEWNLGDQGTAATPTVDTVTDFDATLAGGTDVLDLQDLLVGESAGTLDNYLDFSSDGTNTTINVKSSGVTVDQQIVLQNVNLTSIGDDQAIINALIGVNKLVVDL